MSISGRTILVVDDDIGLGRLLQRSLRRQNHEVVLAHSGREALAWLEGRRADLMLLDLMLVDMPGRQVQQALADRGQSVPFIVITGQGDERVAVEMMKQGALDYLIKDRQFLDFVPAVVERALRQRERDEKLAAAEQALRREHTFISAVLETLGALVVVLDGEGHIVQFNRACEQATGYRQDEVKGRLVWELFIPAAEVEAVKRTFGALRQGAPLNRHENHWLTRDGGRRLIDWSNTSLLDEAGRTEFVIATGIDVTERKRLETEILEISGREQRRIGQDLHDGICQLLAGTELMSQVLEQKLSKKGLPEAKQASQVAEHVREAISQTRMLARGLSPVEMEADGLMSALEVLAGSISKVFGVKCEFARGNTVPIGDNQAATHLYRITQEAINNAIKHGRAGNIRIYLDSVGEKNILRVEDDGRGFTVESAPATGMGLSILSYRARMIGGTLEVVSRPGHGASVVCAFPKSS